MFSVPDLSLSTLLNSVFIFPSLFNAVSKIGLL